jgi:transcriptional regulator with XRE-family HTH domain
VDTSSFPELLRQHRLALGLTQDELAERAGLSGRAISDLERGLKQAPRASTVRLLVRGLGLPDAEAAAPAARGPATAGPCPGHRAHPRPSQPAAADDQLRRAGRRAGPARADPA